MRPPRASLFTRSRLQLTAWYTALIVLLIAALGAGVYLLMTERLDAQIASAMEDDVRLAAPRLGSLVEQAGDTSPRAIVRLDLPVGEAGGEDALAELLEHGRFPAHQLLLDTEGRVLESTLGGLGTVVAVSVDSAMRDGSDVRTLGSEGKRLRVLTVPVTLDGEAIGFVQAFRSLADRDETAADLLRVIAIAGGLGAVAALTTGYWLSGRALDPIRRNLAAQQRFVADASHELRTPVSVVRASADLLLRHPQRRIEEERALVSGIVDETERMGAIVTDLLALTEVEQTALPQRRCDLSELTTEALDGIREPAARAGVELETDVAANVAVRGNPGILAQVVRALVDNAIRHGGEGTRVRVSVASQNGSAVLTVADDGPGIAPEEHARIFERFARIDTSRSRAAGGTGLGLAIVRSAVRRHGGDVHVESASGRGARFVVRLPLAANAPDPTDATR